jgi:hypothetical protein
VPRRIPVRFAEDAKLSDRVMMKSYVRESDPEMRQKSNRTYRRILLALSPDVARVYGYSAPLNDDLVKRIEEAVAAQNWELVRSLSTSHSKKNRTEK